MTRSLSYAFVAALALVSQAAAVGHVPAHHDEPVSDCRDTSTHFCPERLEHETGPCVLCRASTGGVSTVLVGSVDAPLPSEPVVLWAEAGPRSPVTFSPASPRGPPLG